MQPPAQRRQNARPAASPTLSLPTPSPQDPHPLLAEETIKLYSPDTCAYTTQLQDCATSSAQARLIQVEMIANNSGNAAARTCNVLIEATRLLLPPPYPSPHVDQYLTFRQLQTPSPKIHRQKWLSLPQLLFLSIHINYSANTFKTSHPMKRTPASPRLSAIPGRGEATNH